jgi:hypothetical protein
MGSTLALTMKLEDQIQSMQQPVPAGKKLQHEQQFIHTPRHPLLTAGEQGVY